MRIKNKYIPREHWNKQHGNIRTAKTGYESKEEAEQYIKEHNLSEIYRTYKCSICGKFHIGHKNNKL